MSDTATPAKETVDRWLLLEAGDPACNEARDVVTSLGRDVQREAARVAAGLRTPLADVASHRDDGSDIAQTLAALRRELDSLAPAELDAQPGLVAKALALIPGVGTPESRYFKRLESSRSRVTSIVQSLESGRGVLSRDNITLRADQERLHELSASLDQGIVVAQAFDDALVFAIDVELPFGDPRRPLFEDELLVTVRQRMTALGQAVIVNRQGAEAIESIMSNNRELIRGIDRARELTLGAFAVAATAGAARARNAPALDGIDAVDAATADLIADTEATLRTDGPEGRRRRSESQSDSTIELEALRAAFDEIDVALNEIDVRRREALPDLERTVPEGMPVTQEETP